MVHGAKSTVEHEEYSDIGHSVIEYLALLMTSTEGEAMPTTIARQVVLKAIRDTSVLVSMYVAGLIHAIFQNRVAKPYASMTAE